MACFNPLLSDERRSKREALLTATEKELEKLSKQVLRRYKSLSHVEQTFRAMKGIDILVRPIRHRTQERVPTHITSVDYRLSPYRTSG